MYPKQISGHASCQAGVSSRRGLSLCSCPVANAELQHTAGARPYRLDAIFGGGRHEAPCRTNNLAVQSEILVQAVKVG